MIALNGPDRGRIVNIDQDLNRPSPAKEADFLRGYEAWLDRLLEPRPPLKSSKGIR